MNTLVGELLPTDIPEIYACLYLLSQIGKKYLLLHHWLIYGGTAQVRWLGWSESSNFNFSAVLLYIVFSWFKNTVIIFKKRKYIPYRVVGLPTDAQRRTLQMVSLLQENLKKLFHLSINFCFPYLFFRSTLKKQFKNVFPYFFKLKHSPFFFFKWLKTQLRTITTALLHSTISLQQLLRCHLVLFYFKQMNSFAAITVYTALTELSMSTDQLSSCIDCSDQPTDGT